MVIKIVLLILFFTVMVGIGMYARRHAGMIIVPVVSVLTPKPDAEKDNISSCYDEKVTQTKKSTLE